LTLQKIKIKIKKNLILHNNDIIYSAQRKRLIEQLRLRGELSEDVLDAMNKLPREKFVIPSFVNKAYEDSALPIECNQTISQPYTVAYMTSCLRIKKDDKILEIGTGSGYQACLLAMLGARVFSVERIRELFETAKSIINELGFNINLRLGDGSLGWKEFAPFQGIIVTAAAPGTPEVLKSQLAIGGRIVVPVGEKGVQTMYIITRRSETAFDEQTTDRFRFVPLIGKEGWQNQ
jgi:protein-L-isoaspartate(D-aspartate) O-methyltransferase